MSNSTQIRRLLSVIVLTLGCTALLVPTGAMAKKPDAHIKASARPPLPRARRNPSRR